LLRTVVLLYDVLAYFELCDPPSKKKKKRRGGGGERRIKSAVPSCPACRSSPNIRSKSSSRDKYKEKKKKEKEMVVRSYSPLCARAEVLITKKKNRHDILVARVYRAAAF